MDHKRQRPGQDVHCRGIRVDLPCRLGDTIFFIDRVSCYECARADECPGADCGGRGAATPQPERMDYGKCPLGVVEQVVERVAYVADEEGESVVINDMHVFGLEELRDIHFDKGPAHMQLQEVTSHAKET